MIFGTGNANWFSARRAISSGDGGAGRFDRPVTQIGGYDIPPPGIPERNPEQTDTYQPPERAGCPFGGGNNPEAGR